MGHHLNEKYAFIELGRKIICVYDDTIIIQYKLHQVIIMCSHKHPQG